MLLLFGTNQFRTNFQHLIFSIHSMCMREINWPDVQCEIELPYMSNAVLKIVETYGCGGLRTMSIFYWFGAMFRIITAIVRLET